MKKIALLCFTLLSFISTTFAQSLDQYKYVIVPSKFDFMEEANKFRLNEMTVFFLNERGFSAFLENDKKFPEAVRQDRCAALTIEVHSESKTFSFVTKLTFVLKDCYGKVVFKSKEGRSQLKEYKFAYRQALRDAFTSLEKEGSTYTPTKTVEKVEEKTTQKIKKTVEKKAENTRKVQKIVYVSDSDKYVLNRVDAKVFELKNISENKIKAKLFLTSKGNFIYKEGNLNGSAYFDGNGNIVIEYFDPVAGGMKKVDYEKVD